MHPIQNSVLQILENKGFLPLQLREIARLVGEEHPQKIKHHLQQLEKRGLIKIDLKKMIISKKERKAVGEGQFISLPILGFANCGEATFFARDNIEGILKVSKNLLWKIKEDLFVLKASGDSMNKAAIHGKHIENGDYVVVDGSNKEPQNKEYIVSLINGCANIKKFIRDTENNQIVLISDSTQDYPPIFIHADDDYAVAGKVIQVIKQPKI